VSAVPRLLVVDDLDRGGAGAVELLPALVTEWRTLRRRRQDHLSRYKSGYILGAEPH
jgi:hypothetical protein